jgi:hypothetical protein
MNNSISILSVLKDTQSDEAPCFRCDNEIEMEKHKYFRQALDARFITTTDHGENHSSAGYQYYGASVTLNGADYIHSNDGSLLRREWVNRKNVILGLIFSGVSGLVYFILNLIYEYNFVEYVKEALTFIKQ